jgi:hypothetical protein
MPAALADRLMDEARQARLVAGNVTHDSYRAMLLGLAGRLEKEAAALRQSAASAQPVSEQLAADLAPASIPDALP